MILLKLEACSVQDSLGGTSETLMVACECSFLLLYDRGSSYSLVCLDASDASQTCSLVVCQVSALQTTMQHRRSAPSGMQLEHATFRTSCAFTTRCQQKMRFCT